MSFFVIVHNIRSLYNVGSIFRTAECFGIDKLYLTGYTGTPKNPRLGKTALGAERIVPWEHRRQLQPLLKRLRAAGIMVVALENHVASSIPLRHFTPRFPLALLLGEEVGGINRKFLPLCDRILEIPLSGHKESLNVAVAFGIAAYHIANAKCKYHPPRRTK